MLFFLAWALTQKTGARGNNGECLNGDVHVAMSARDPFPIRPGYVIDCKDYVTGIGNGSRALIAICTSPLRHSPLLPRAPVFCVSAQARKKSTTKLPYTTLK